MRNAQVQAPGPLCDVLCVGTALIDHLSFASFDSLSELGLPQGAMTLVDVRQAAAIADKLGPGTALSGGTVANTAVGIASLGGHPTFLGAVSTDHLGERYRDDLLAEGVRPLLEWLVADLDHGAATGACYVIVTPDAERTMATTLGVSGLLSAAMVTEELVAGARLAYFDGYLLDFPDASELIAKLVQYAKANDTLLAVGLADRLVIERHREKLMALLASVDVVFSNEAEALALSGAGDSESAVELLSRHVRRTVVTRGPAGALMSDEHGVVEIAPVQVAEVVDLTGAGDLFAAGVCFGLTHGLDSATSGRLGALCASEVISHLGARPQINLADLARKHGVEIDQRT